MTLLTEHDVQLTKIYSSSSTGYKPTTSLVMDSICNDVNDHVKKIILLLTEANAKNLPFAHKTKIWLKKEGIVSTILSLLRHHHQHQPEGPIKNFTWVCDDKGGRLLLDKIPRLGKEEWEALTVPGLLSARTFRRYVYIYIPLYLPVFLPPPLIFIPTPIIDGTTFTNIQTL